MYDVGVGVTEEGFSIIIFCVIIIEGGGEVNKRRKKGKNRLCLHLARKEHPEG
jgi:hypothetical protein